MSRSTKSAISAVGTTAVLALAGLAAAPAHADTAAVTTWTGLVSAFNAGGTVTLGADIDDPSATHDSLAVPLATSVTLDLDGHSLTIDNANDYDAGIRVASTTTNAASLTIKDSHPGASNSLTVTGGAAAAGGGAGIGGASSASDADFDGGEVVIDSGTVAATGGVRSAGIGGGYSGTGGQVTINGGTVKANGGDRAAGIGGGYPAGEGGQVTINGGTITATGGNHGAGIGGGYSGAGGTVSINGGTVTANGELGGAGVGGGHTGAGGEVTIDGGTVTATGGQGSAGIGGGAGGSGGGPVTIKAGTITATGGGYGAGIGGGAQGDGGDVTIAEAAMVTATGGGSGDESAVGPGDGATDTGSFTNGGTLTLPKDSTLRVPSGATVTNTGIIHNDGQLYGDGGTLANNGTIINGPDALVAHDGDGVAGGFLISGHNYTLTYDLGTLGGTAPDAQHVYAATPAAAQLSVAPIPAKGYAWTTTVGSSATAVTTRTNLTKITATGPSTIALTATKVTNPSVTAHIHPAKPRRAHHGWYRSTSVRVTYTCAAGSAPVITCPAATTLKANGAHRIARTIHATDSGIATAHVTIRIDHKAPKLRVRGVKKHHTYRHQPKIRCHATDRHSGIDKIGRKTCVIKRHKTHRRGHVTTWVYKVIAHDRASNKTVKKGTYKIRR